MGVLEHNRPKVTLKRSEGSETRNSARSVQSVDQLNSCIEPTCHLGTG